MQGLTRAARDFRRPEKADPNSEIWMSTHPRCTACIVTSGEGKHSRNRANELLHGARRETLSMGPKSLNNCRALAHQVRAWCRQKPVVRKRWICRDPSSWTLKADALRQSLHGSTLCVVRRWPEDRPRPPWAPFACGQRPHTGGPGSQDAQCGAAASLSCSVG